MKNKNQENFGKVFDDLWNHWIFLSDIRVGVNFNAFKEGIKSEFCYLLECEKTKNRQKFIDALIWCSGSDDFQVGGKARKGWEKICLPLLKKDERN